MRIIIYSTKYFYTFFSLNHTYVTYITYLKKETKKQFSESSIISETTQPVYNPGRGRYIYMLLCRWWHSLRSFTTGYRDNTPVGVSISPLGMYDILRVRHTACTRRRSYPGRGITPLSLYADMHRVRHTACTRHRGYPDRGITPTRHVPICTESDTQHTPDGVATLVGVSLTRKKEKGHRTEVR